MGKGKVEHDFHLVNPSAMPLVTSLSALITAIGFVLFMHKTMIGNYLFPLGFLLLLSSMYSWWADVIKEGRQDHAHTYVVRRGLSLGMLLFIISEIMFFFVFFWGFFKAALDPAYLLDDVWATILSKWPPEGVITLDPWDLPLINTLILLLSGTTVTWAHYAIIHHNKKEAIIALKLTIGLGIFFTIMQAIEYSHAAFKFTDGIYSSVFYMATGFHGAHVIIGTIFLIVSLIRVKKDHFAKGYNHLGFVFAAWYWHFVDVVWLFLFIFIYVWGR